jgi:adenine-specific DNA-methyltransferase
MPIPEHAVRAIHDLPSLLKFLERELQWKLPQNPTAEDVTFEWSASELRLNEAAQSKLKDGTVLQIKKMAHGQPWGIFIVNFTDGQVYKTALRQVLRGLVPKRRRDSNLPAWKHENILFICTTANQQFTFAHFKGEKPERARLATFSWEAGSTYIRTLCEFNLPSLKFPETTDIFGLDPNAWLVQWSSAFDVKKVTDEFYKEYDAVFREMKMILAPKFNVNPRLYQKDYEEWTEKERKQENKLHLFVQNLVNRLMFLKFLEKRLWLDFNPNYLLDLYHRALSERKNFYKDYLFYVFFAGLNRQVPLVVLSGEKIAFQAQMFQDRIGVLPFLNGGLFEKEPIDEKIEIPNEVFKSLFELFSRYNFTVNEDTPLDVEVAVNPEMLGKVFEESVIARKEKGAYYTPRTIVSFMCREALKNHLGRCNIANAQTKIEELVDQHSAEELDAADAIEIYKALNNIKVLDPAVGSGAFPVNMMLELVQIYKTLGEKLEHDHPYLIQNKLANPKDVYNLKKQIIQNSLYGVDIEEFAINIARLRFWLSLAVDFPINFSTREEFIQRVHEIEPLPNLLYKLRCGDSLLAHYHGVSLEPHGRIATGEYNTARRNRIKSSINDILQLKQEFYKEKDSDRKKGLQHEIEVQLKQLVINEINIEIAALQQDLGQGDLFGLTKKEREERKQIEHEIGRLQNVRDELATMEGLPPDFPVIWDVEFGEVLSEGGFDVVIANPPYVRQEEIKHLKEDLKLHYECYTGTSDLYVYFYERGIQLLKNNGTLCFISSNKFFRAGYGEKLREYLMQKASINTIIDFGDLPVFEATTYPCVLIATKNGTEARALKAIALKRQEQLERFEEIYRQEAITMQPSDLSIEGWRIENRTVLGLLEKIKKGGVALEEYVGGKIYRGITTGYNEAFIIDEATKKRLIKEDKKSAEVIKPFLRGRDIKRYAIEDPGLSIIYVPFQWTNGNRGRMEPETFFKKELPSIHRHLKQFEEQLIARDDQGDYWWEMRPCKYLEEFEKPKIMLPDISPTVNFAFDRTKSFCGNTAYIIPIADQVLLANLNSSVTTFFYSKLSSTVRGGYLRFIYQHLSQIPIPKPNQSNREAIEERVEKILAAKKNYPAADTSQLEREIDQIVYKLYGLTEEEIKIVEGK